MKCNATTRMIWLKFAANLPKSSMDDLNYLKFAEATAEANFR